PEKKAPEVRPTVELTMPLPTRKLPNPLVAKLVDGSHANFAAPIIADQADQPLAIAFHDLRNEGTPSARVATRVQTDRCVHLDVTVKNNSVALERLRSALHEVGIKVVVDPATAKSLAPRDSKVEYWVYAENIKTDELSRILRDLSHDDNKLQ